jgi:phage-related holin
MGQWNNSLLYVIISNAWVYDYLMGQWDYSLLYVIISNAWVYDYLMGQWDNSLLYVIITLLIITYRRLLFHWPIK